MQFIRWTALKNLKDKLLGRNRRHAARTRSRNLVKHKLAEPSNPEFLSNLVDLSESGLQFSFRYKMKIGTVMNMTLNLAEDNENIPVLGKVAWVKPFDGRSSGFRVGVTFLDISFQGQETIRRVIRRKHRVPSTGS